MMAPLVNMSFNYKKGYGLRCNKKGSWRVSNPNRTTHAKCHAPVKQITNGIYLSYQ